jgi:hypothetical protein
MKHALIAALLLSGAAPLVAQDTLTSTSGSGAEANSGSVSGAQSNNTANNNAGIGSSENTNTTSSNAGAISGSASESTSNSNGNTQGQSTATSTEQGQEQGQNQNQSQGQEQNLSAANEQGVTVNQTWNTKNRRQTEVRTNNAVPLAASSSFSSDYCGGTVSGGASVAPIGISLGGAAPKFDKSCQALRRSEKFGMAAVNAQNMGQPVLAGKLMSMMIWSICTSDSGGPDAGKTTAQACEQMLLLGPNAGSDHIAQPAPGETPQPRIADRRGKVTPEAAYRSLQQQPAQMAEKVAATQPPSR